MSMPKKKAPAKREKATTARAVLVYENGQVIVRQGTVCESMYVIEKGEAEVLYAQEGKGAVRQRVLGKGDFFGEVPFLERIASPGTARVTVRALGQVQVLPITRHALLHRIHEHPELGYRMLLTISRRMRAMEEEMIRLFVGI